MIVCQIYQDAVRGVKLFTRGIQTSLRVDEEIQSCLNEHVNYWLSTSRLRFKICMAAAEGAECEGGLQGHVVDPVIDNATSSVFKYDWKLVTELAIFKVYKQTSYIYIEFLTKMLNVYP